MRARAQKMRDIRRTNRIATRIAATEAQITRRSSVGS
jgi:hypothetical protein